MTQSAMLGGLAGGIALALDIELGFMDRLATSPVARASIVIGRLAGTAVVGVLSGAWFIAAGLIFGARIEGGVAAVILVMAVAGLAAVAFGAVCAAIALRAGRITVLQGLFPLLFVVMFLSSAWFPRDLLLEPAESVADFNPLSFMAEGMREPIIGEIALGPTLEALGGIAVVMGLGAVLSAMALRARLRSG